MGKIDADINKISRCLFETMINLQKKNKTNYKVQLKSNQTLKI
jgi:hypothetical protein